MSCLIFTSLVNAYWKAKVEPVEQIVTVTGKNVVMPSFAWIFYNKILHNQQHIYFITPLSISTNETIPLNPQIITSECGQGESQK